MLTVPPALVLPVVAGGEKPFKTAEALEAWVVGYAAHPEPARLPGALRDTMALGLLTRLDLLAFFTTAARRSPEVRASLEAALVNTDLAGTLATLIVFRSLGEDIADRLIFLPDEFRGHIAAFPALADPKVPLAWAEAPSAEAVQRALDQVEAALGAWRATGDVAYFSVLTSGLAHGADHPAFLAWTQAEARSPNPAPAVARGCYYDRTCTALRRLRTAPKARTELEAWVDAPPQPAWLREALRRLPR